MALSMLPTMRSLTQVWLILLVMIIELRPFLSELVEPLLQVEGVYLQLLVLHQIVHIGDPSLVVSQLSEDILLSSVEGILFVLLDLVAGIMVDVLLIVVCAGLRESQPKLIIYSSYLAPIHLHHLVALVLTDRLILFLNVYLGSLLGRLDDGIELVGTFAGS